MKLAIVMTVIIIGIIVGLAYSFKHLIEYARNR